MRWLFVLGLAGCAAIWPAPSARDDDDASSPAEYAAHLRSVARRLRELGLAPMRARVEAPFVVLDDGDPRALRRHAETVRWVVARLERELFRRRPNHIIDIYLFESAASYARGVRALTGEDASTPYGFYSPAERAMFVNISTGGGTLVHELVHPYVEADCPDAPVWINEGLGALFEQSADRDGQLVGLVNWRLGGLQRTIRRGDVPSLVALTRLPHARFYGDTTGTHYAQARFVMFYLQERGLLRRFYRLFRAGRATDPTGYRTLLAVAGARDGATFQRRWARFVLRLDDAPRYRHSARVEYAKPTSDLTSASIR